MKYLEKLKHVPKLPGCYLMKNKDNQIIYVGKAKNLNNRVKSYFTGLHNIKTTKLVSEIVNFDFVVTNSEQESLILELNLIKKHRPKYNIVFMDDKTYPYIEITKTDPPKIKVVRSKKVKGQIFGPYPNVKSARDTARLLQLLFPMGRIEPIPNFYEEIGNDIVKKYQAKTYDDYVKIIIRFLKGDIKIIVDALSLAMDKYSEMMMYERAAALRDNISHIKTTTEKQIISLNDYKDRDFISIAYNEEDIALQILFMRSGKIIDQYQMVFAYIGNPINFILSYLAQYYENHLPDELLFDNMFGEKSLKSQFGNIALIPKIGDKRKIIKLAHKNANIDLSNHQMLYRNKRQQTLEQLDKLKDLLQLDSNHLIEIFDNSQLFGTAPISAMVVFKDGRFQKKLYRKYHIKQSTNDDYMAMREVIYRRYRRVLMEKLTIPSLILVDGGKGQLSAARDVLAELGANINIAGLKKNDKHQLESVVYNNKEINLTDHRDVYKLLSSLSDEVHRYAISFHRKTRRKGAKKSILDDIKGLGPKRKITLLKSFKNIEEIKKASFEQLKAIGLPKNVINNIKEVLK